jgi:hypothetical protein
MTIRSYSLGGLGHISNTGNCGCPSPYYYQRKSLDDLFKTIEEKIDEIKDQGYDVKQMWGKIMVISRCPGDEYAVRYSWLPTPTSR